MRRFGIALSMTLALAPASAAQAQDGVYVDPDSPAGVEYQLPLERARQEASGTVPNRPAEGAQKGSRDAPLFGAGVEPDARSSARGGAADPAEDSGRGTEPGRSLPAATAEIAGGGRSEMGTSLLILLAVLLVGGGGGFALRRLWQ